MKSYSGICSFCGWKTPKTTELKTAKKLLKEHYQKNHPRECAEDRIEKWGGVGCLKCSSHFYTATRLESYRKCPNCGYDMSAWFAGMVAFASGYETEGE